MYWVITAESKIITTEDRTLISIESILLRYFAAKKTPRTPPVIKPILLNKLCKKPNLKPEIAAISNEIKTINQRQDLDYFLFDSQLNPKSIFYLRK